MPAEILLPAALMLLLLSASMTFILLKADRQTKRALVWRQDVLAVHGKTTANGRDYSIARAEAGKGGLAQRLAHLIGVDTARAQNYDHPPALVITAAVLPALAIRWLMHGLLGPFAWLLVPVCWLWCARSYYTSADAKRRKKLLQQFPDALSTIVRAVRVGIPVTEALNVAAREAPQPTAGEFALLYDQIVIGTSLEEALVKFASSSRLTEYRFFAMTLSVQTQTGGGLSETLENLADVIRRRVALQARGYALAAEARTSAMVLAVLPLFAGGALAILSPAYLRPLLTEGPGQMVLGVATLWLGLGLTVMRWMILKSLA